MDVIAGLNCNADAALPVAIPQRMRGLQLQAQRLSQAVRPHDCAVLCTLAFAYHERAALKVDILDAKPQTFIEPQAGAIERARHQAHLAMESTENSGDFTLSEH